MSSEKAKNEENGRAAACRPEADTAQKGHETTAEEYRDKYLRAHAEVENMRKRFAREREEFVKFANEGLLTELLYAVDNFDLAIGHMNTSQKVESIIDGIKMIQRQFHGLMEKNGVTRIDALGRKFDPHLHEAVSHVEDDGKEEDTVVEEVRSGYLINGRVLRPAVVRISKKSV